MSLWPQEVISAMKSQDFLFVADTGFLVEGLMTFFFCLIICEMQELVIVSAYYMLANDKKEEHNTASSMEQLPDDYKPLSKGCLAL